MRPRFNARVGSRPRVTRRVDRRQSVTLHVSGPSSRALVPRTVLEPADGWASGPESAGDQLSLVESTGGNVSLYEMYR